MRHGWVAKRHCSRSQLPLLDTFTPFTLWLTSRGGWVCRVGQRAKGNNKVMGGIDYSFGAKVERS